MHCAVLDSLCGRTSSSGLNTGGEATLPLEVDGVIAGLELMGEGVGAVLLR